MAMIVFSESEGRREWPLKAVTRLGRAADNDIQLASPRASSYHAVIRREGGRWVIEDNQSTNGTYVNGRRITRATLREDDTIAIGGLSLTFRTQVPPGTSTIFLAGEAPSEVEPGEEGAARRAEEVLESVFKDDSRIETFATTAVRLPSEVEARPEDDPAVVARRFRASYEISKAVAATLDIAGVMDRVLGSLFEIFRAAERAFILLVDPETGEISSGAVRRRVPTDTQEIGMSRTALRQAMDRREAILCTDAMRDGRYAAAQSVVNLGIRSMMIAPLVFQDRTLGAIYVDTRSAAGRFSQPDLELLSAAAAQVAGCVANAQLHEQVVKTERLAAVGQTVAGLSHCVKNILQGIKGGAFIVDKALEKGDADGVKRGWDMVKRNNAFMENLVFDLLSYSKQRTPEYRPTDLNALCGEIAELATARARQKGVTLTFQPDEALPSVEADPNGIRRCVLNLAMNAVDACEKNHGTVTLFTEAPGADGSARIGVRDTGCGMSEAVKAKLFTVFFSTKRSKGTGLGLPVTKKIIEEHGGRIEVASREGEGSTFLIHLPVARPATGGDAPA